MAYRALVIDDDASFLELMQQLLGGEGYQVATCQQSRLAHQMARSFHPDVITLDLRMPDPSGWDVLASIKGDGDLRCVPVILISAAGAELAETSGRLHALGFPGVEVLVKPFEIDELLSRVAEAVVMAARR